MTTRPFVFDTKVNRMVVAVLVWARQWGHAYYFGVEDGAEVRKRSVSANKYGHYIVTGFGEFFDLWTVDGTTTYTSITSP